MIFGPKNQYNSLFSAKNQLKYLGTPRIVLKVVLAYSVIVIGREDVENMRYGKEV